MKMEMKYSGPSQSDLALDYWETCDARQGGVIGHISQIGFSIRSHVNMRVGGNFTLGFSSRPEMGLLEFRFWQASQRKNSVGAEVGKKHMNMS